MVILVLLGGRWSVGRLVVSGKVKGKVRREN